MAEPGIFTKGPVLRQMDEVANDPTQRDAFLEALKYSQRDLVTVFVDYGIANDEQVAYLRRFWFNPDWANPDSGCWWLEHQPIEPIFRQGIIKAIELATCPPDGDTPARILPINSCWVCAGTEFQMGICATDDQVTCIILTPNLSMRAYAYQRRPDEIAKLTFDGPFWAVKRGKENVEPWEVDQEMDDRTQVVTVRFRTRP